MKVTDIPYHQLVDATAFEQAIQGAVDAVKSAVVQYNINSNAVDQQLLKQRSQEYTSREYLKQQMQDQTDIAVAEKRNLYNFKQMGVNEALVPFVQQMYPDLYIKSSGFFVYPANYGFMSWHTNSNAPGKRIYIAYAEQDVKSFFRYYDADNSQMITSWDAQGINAREFHVDSQDLLWHCVYAECNRYSFGFRALTAEQMNNA
jgi:hypothetical protein